MSLSAGIKEKMVRSGSEEERCQDEGCPGQAMGLLASRQVSLCVCVCVHARVFNHQH